MNNPVIEDKGLSSRYAPWLWVIVIVFTGRVFAQLSLVFFEIPFLPPFESWFSGAISYPKLLASQVMIIVVMVMVSWRISQGIVNAKRQLGIVLLVAGSIYFLAMVARLVIGIVGMSEAIWFNRPIPSFFHIVLATYILLVGHYHLAMSRQKGGQK